MRHCPQCGSEFQGWVINCVDCGTRLVEGPVQTPEDVSEDDQSENVQPADGDAESVEKIEDFVDEVLNPDDFINPDARDDYGQPVNVTPRANLVSVVQNPAKEVIARSASALADENIRTYLLKKTGVFDYFYVLMVEEKDFEKATQILEDTQYGTLIPIDPEVEDPELKGAPVINLDEKIDADKSQEVEPDQDQDRAVVCPLCQSARIEVKTAFFSSRIKLKCRICGNSWESK
jgi:hypothetical protein